MLVPQKGIEESLQESRKERNAKNMTEQHKQNKNVTNPDKGQEASESVQITKC